MPWPTDHNGNCWGSDEYVDPPTPEEIREQMEEDKHRASYNYPDEKKTDESKASTRIPSVCCNELMHGVTCRVCKYNYVRNSYE